MHDEIRVIRFQAERTKLGNGETVLCYCKGVFEMGGLLNKGLQLVLKMNPGDIRLVRDIFNDYHFVIDDWEVLDKLKLPGFITVMKMKEFGKPANYMFDNSESGVIRVWLTQDFEEEQKKLREQFKEYLPDQKKEGG